MNSSGVSFASLTGKNEKVAKKYKLFKYPKLLRVIRNRLVKQLITSKTCLAKPTVKLCLAAGKIKNEENKGLIKSHFDKKGWLLFDNIWIREKLKEYAQSDYENEVAAVVTKLMT